ncbi:hypothetical protein LCGC14_2475710 [marine sediment metagenome]|uniref:Uncharacterized protein n=1 Tax=marine sediment metagenome TaxID=412755 RepID=A0A0F9BWY4_9ZZZZ
MGRDLLIAAKVDLYTESCNACGILFAMPAEMNRRLRDDGGTFYCPNGHSLHYVDTTAKKLEAAERQLKAAQANADFYCHQRDGALESLNAANKETRRLKRRAHAGVCPDCNRHFVNVERHMKSKHGTPLEPVA